VKKYAIVLLQVYKIKVTKIHKQRKEGYVECLETRKLRKVNGVTIGFGTIKGSESNYEIKSLCWMKCIPEHMSVSESAWYR